MKILQLITTIKTVANTISCTTKLRMLLLTQLLYHYRRVTAKKDQPRCYKVGNEITQIHNKLPKDHKYKNSPEVHIDTIDTCKHFFPSCTINVGSSGQCMVFGSLSGPWVIV